MEYDNLMQVANNVILFPRSKSSSSQFPKSIEEIEDNIDTVRQAHIQQTLEQVVPMLFDNLALAGFQTADEMVFLKDGALVVEAARSFLNKIYGMTHPLQIIAENLFDKVDDEGSLEVSTKVKIVITPQQEKS